ncbi:MAG: BatA domain-containing protein [Planctomycetota bacterium]
MTLLNPIALIWALLAVPIVVLYAWRARPRRHSVPTGFLWEQVFSRARGRSTWWPLRHLVSLGVQLAVLALLIAALAEPEAHPPEPLSGDVPERQSILLDDGGLKRADANDLRARAGPVASRAEMVAAGSSGPPLWLFPAAAALVLLAAEWHLFQRRWTC